MKFLAIDPGVEFGWALFDTQSQLPENFGVYTPKRTMDWLSRCRDSSKFFHGLLRPRLTSNNHPRVQHVDLVVCEWPAYRESSAGRAAAASDSLVKLSVLVGMFVQVCHATGIVFEPVPVPTWMGNMPPQTLERRVFRLMGVLGDAVRPVSHAVDAVGLGFWKKGLL